MKKFLPLALVLLVLVGVGFYIRGKQRTTQTLEKQGNGTLLPVTEKGGVISSIKDAIGLGKKMKCTSVTPDGSGNQSSSTIFVDGKKYKFSAEANGEISYGIFDGETQYMWSGNTKQGLKMTKACIDELSKAVPQNGSDNTLSTPETPQDFEDSFGGGAGVNCEPTSEDFSIPTDVKFVDQCEMMKNSLKALEGIKGNLPAGVNIPGY